MDDNDKMFYGAIMVACVLGLVMVAYTITSSPKYEENFTELYFYGEKVDLSGGEGEFGEYMVSIVDGDIFFTGGEEQVVLGPYHNGSTVMLDSAYWNVEDVSEDLGQMMLRKMPLRADQGAEVNGTFVIVNHKNRDINYLWEVSSPLGSFADEVLVAKGAGKAIDFTVTLPEVDSIPVEKTGEYQEEYETYTRLVEDYGEYKRITITTGEGFVDIYWRAKISISLNTGEEIHFWIRLDDE